MTNFDTWLNERVDGALTHEKLAQLHDQLEAIAPQDETHEQDIAVVKQAVASAKEDWMYPLTPELEAIDPTTLV